MNMSYCRFENTLADLRDCDRSMHDGEDGIKPMTLGTHGSSP